ncbi:MAG: sigma-54 dependent transcriptional regulator [Acidobacteriota bacterium]
MSQRVLLVESHRAEDRLPLEQLIDSLEDPVVHVSWNAFDPLHLESSQADLVLAVDVPETPAALHFLEWLRTHSPTVPAFGILPVNAGDSLLSVASQSLDDFLLWPARDEELRHRVRRLLIGPNPKEASDPRLSEEFALRRLVGQSACFRQAVARIPLVAATDVPVLITGETGTGKELVARAVHDLSHRRKGPFVPVDCSALPEHLFENEVFGHERGAFTDAHRRREGLVALAEGGTLFLDEVDSLAAAAQAKLLRLLQEKTYRPLGSERFLHADVRVLAASNRDLEAAVRRQQLRADLFFRLDVLRLHLPPLRERAGDIALLARTFLNSLQPPDAARRTLSGSALRKLSLYSWPGNVRELWTVLQRTVVFAEGPQILPQDLTLPGSEDGKDDLERPFRAARAQAVAAFERTYVEDLLRRNGGNVTRAAREARKERRSFGRLVKKYGLRASEPSAALPSA